MDPKIIHVRDSKLPFLLFFLVTFADVIPSASIGTVFLWILVVCAHETAPKKQLKHTF